MIMRLTLNFLETAIYIGTSILVLPYTRTKILQVKKVAYHHVDLTFDS